MDMDAIEEGLASYGVIFFQPRPPESTPKPDLKALTRACLESREPRYEGAVEALLLAVPEGETRPAVAALKEGLPAHLVRRLRWLTLAADYFAVIYEADWKVLLGRKPAIPADLFDRGRLPAAEVDDGDLGWKMLAEEIGGSDPLVNWRGTLEEPARVLVDFLWTERSSALARARHARAH